MKRMIISALLLVGLVACQKKDAEPEATEKPADVTAEQPTTIEPAPAPTPTPTPAEGEVEKAAEGAAVEAAEGAEKAGDKVEAAGDKALEEAKEQEKKPE